MATRKYDPYGRYRGDLGYAQIIYLRKVKWFSTERVAQITGYAESTIRGYENKYAHLYPQAVELFEDKPGIIPSHLNGNWCYCIRVYCDGNYVFDKIGTTTRNPDQRIREVIRDGWKGYDGKITYKVMGLVECGPRDPVGLEKLLHGFLIAQGFQHIPNDRFYAPGLEYEALFNFAKQVGYKNACNYMVAA